MSELTPANKYRSHLDEAIRLLGEVTDSEPHLSQIKLLAAALSEMALALKESRS